MYFCQTFFVKVSLSNLIFVSILSFSFKLLYTLEAFVKLRNIIKSLKNKKESIKKLKFFQNNVKNKEGLNLGINFD